MNVITKAVATITPGVDDATSEHGTFDVILSAQSKDRDGETLRSDEWKQPLPDHITFDIDHGMTVASTVGSGAPFINDDGNLQVKGSYSSIPRAQEVRTLINEKHIRTTSVTFMTTKTAKSNDGKAERELLNGSFVPIPSNRDTVVLASKALDAVEKAGARNNSSDLKAIQAIHDQSATLGAYCSTADAQRADTGEMDGANKSVGTVSVGTVYVDLVPRVRAAVVESAGGSAVDQVAVTTEKAAPVRETESKSAGAVAAKTSVAYVAKALSNSVEDLQGRIRDALTDVYPDDDPDTWVWLEATFLDAGGKSGSVVYSLNGDSLSRTFTDDGNQVTLGDEVTDVTIVTTVVPEGAGKDDDGGDMKSLARKAVSDADWDGSASRFTIEQYRASCLIGPESPSDSKSDYKLPVKELNGDVNRNAVHAVAAALAGGRGGVDASTDEKVRAAKTLVGLYRNQLKEDPPDSVLELAGESPKGDDSKSADPASAAVKAADAGSADEDVMSLRARALQIELQAQALL